MSESGRGIVGWISTMVKFTHKLLFSIRLNLIHRCPHGTVEIDTYFPCHEAEDP